MGPIVSSGFALAIYDFELLKKSLKNLTIAAVVSLTSSCMYFLLTPLKDAQSELIARTTPNIYDILIAFFGGLVGAIAITRSEKGNPIPGVAIATALMPPLCTAGYGLATGNLKFLFGALFLFFINAVFICLATVLIVKLIKLPVPEVIDKSKEKIIRYSLTLIIIILIVPALLFAYQLYTEQKFNEKINNFIDSEFTNKGYTVVFKKTDYRRSPKTVEIALLSKRFTKSEIDSLNLRINTLPIPETNLIFRQASSDRTELIQENILNELHGIEAASMEKDKKIEQLQQTISKKDFDTKAILGEATIIFPGIESLAISNQVIYTFNDSSSRTIILYKSGKELLAENKNKMKEWCKRRLGVDSLELVRRVD
jgi:uncharacterized hydrophobic protein (TIGR00271 family)